MLCQGTAGAGSSLRTGSCGAGWAGALPARVCPTASREGAGQVGERAGQEGAAPSLVY